MAAAAKPSEISDSVALKEIMEEWGTIVNSPDISFLILITPMPMIKNRDWVRFDINITGNGLNP